MKYEDRIQLQVTDLNKDFLNHIVAYGLDKSSGHVGPGCVIMIAEDGKSYQFYGETLNKLDYYTGWHELFPIINQIDGTKWNIVTDVLCTKLIIRSDIYELYMENRAILQQGIDYEWEDACIKAALLLKASSDDEIEAINWKYELRKPCFRNGDLVTFDFDNGKQKIQCKGVVAGPRIRRVRGKIEQIEYSIYGVDYLNPRDKCLYKHVDERCIEEATGHMLVISSLQYTDREEVIEKIINSSPDKYVTSIPATTKDQELGEVEGKDFYYYPVAKFVEKVANHEFLEFSKYGKEFIGITKNSVYKDCFCGKDVFLNISADSLYEIKENHPYIHSVYILPDSFESLIRKLNNDIGTITHEDLKNRLVKRYLWNCLKGLDFVSEYDFLFVNDGRNDFIIKSLFDPALKTAKKDNTKEKMIVEQLKVDIKKHLEEII